jgi:hypothetical protein
MPHPQDTAIAHVATLAGGEPADPSWRVTLHLHPAGSWPGHRSCSS